MKKKLIIYPLLLSLLLTGCSSTNCMLSYKDQSESQVLSSLDEGEEGTLFASDLCVVPDGTDKGTDKSLQAESLFLADITDNKALYADNIYQKMYPASITKIVTALVALKYGNLEETVTFSHKASHITEPGAKLCGFQEGDQVKFRDLLSAFLVYSGNDAGVAIAEHVAGSEKKFADMMNEEAKRIGATGSHFVNSHGLHDDNHYTTAYDIYLFFHELVNNYGTFVDIVSSGSTSVVYKDAKGVAMRRTFSSTDRYLIGTQTPPEGVTVIGGKTGTTSLAGSCLVLLSEDDNAHKYISVVLKATTGDELFSEMNHLLDKINHKQA